MSNVALSGNASGTGTFTIASPNSNTDRTLNLPDASGTFLMEGASQSPTFGTVTATTTNTTSLAVNGNNISAVNSLGFRNRIINGDMRIDQRNNGASVTASDTGNAVYTLDRWAYRVLTASKISVQQSSVAPAGFKNSLLVTSLSSYSIGASEFLTVRQPIEGFNAADLDWGTANARSVTLSFWVRSSLTGTFGGSVWNSAENRNYVYSYTISAANTWEQKTVTIPGDTSGTWLTTNGMGLMLVFCVGAGTNFQQTPGSWGNVFLSPNGQVNVAGTNGATWQVTGVQLEAGSVATPFERRDYGRELIMCQRYFEKSYNIDVVPGTSTLPGISASVAAGNGTSLYGTSIVFKATKRANPTMSGWTHTGISGSWHFGVFGASEGTAAISFGNIAMSSVQPFMITTPGGQNALYGHWTASSEL